LRRGQPATSPSQGPRTRRAGERIFAILLQGFRAVAVRPTQSDKGVHAPLRCFASSGGFYHGCPQASCSAALLRPCPVVSGFERRAEWAMGHLVGHQYGCIHPKTRRSSSKPTTAPMSSRMMDRSGRPPTLARTGSAGTEGAGFIGNGTEGVGARIASAAPSAAFVEGRRIHRLPSPGGQARSPPAAVLL
jgi:hypothetical protein